MLTTKDLEMLRSEARADAIHADKIERAAKGTISICKLDLKVGDIAHFHGARFEIYSTNIVDGHNDREWPDEKVMVAMGKWLDGHTVTGYFGPGKDWNFQGNHRAYVDIEM